MATENESSSRQLSLSKDLYTNTACHFIGILSPRSKHLLTLPEEERIGGAFSDLLTEMENTRYFTMFSNRTKELLAKKLKLVSRKADEILLEQGEDTEPPQAFYIIVSGVVSERYEQSSAEDGAPVLWPEKILRKGDFFGHVDIAHDRPPTVTARTVGYSELLVLPKEDFAIAREELEALCRRIAHYLRSNAAVSRFGWSDEEYKVLEIYSKLCKFAEDEDIYCGGAEDSSRPFWSYFVVLGECRIVRELCYTADAGVPRAVPHQLRRELKATRMVTDRFEFEVVKQGFYFGVGEKFEDNHVIASSTLECLLIPRLLLVFKDRELLGKMAQDLTDSLPSDQEVLDDYSKMMSASKEKTKLFRELFKNKPERLIKK